MLWVGNQEEAEVTAEALLLFSFQQWTNLESQLPTPQKCLNWFQPSRSTGMVPESILSHLTIHRDCLIGKSLTQSQVNRGTLYTQDGRSRIVTKSEASLDYIEIPNEPGSKSLILIFPNSHFFLVWSFMTSGCFSASLNPDHTRANHTVWMA